MTLTIEDNYLEITTDRTRSILLPLKEIVLDGSVSATGQDGESFVLTYTDISSPVFSDNSDLYDYLQTNGL